MNKKIVFAFILIVFAGVAVNAETIKEETFLSIGYEEELLIEGANQQKCTEIVFFDEFNQEEFTIISVHYSFAPDVKGDANITVELNNELLSEIKPGTGKEFERIILQKNKLKEKNYLKICGHTSDSITKIKVFNDSKIGNYKTAFFPEESFKKEVVSKEKIVGKEISIKTSIKNYGNASALIEIIDGDADRKDIELIKGKSSFKGEIKAGEEISLEFTYRLKDERTRVLPNAKAFYINEFGETKELYSNYPEIKPLTEKALEPIIMLKKQINFLGEKSIIQVIIINHSTEQVKDAELKLFSSPEAVLGETAKKFEVIQPKETVYFTTSISSTEAGEIELNCNLSFEGQENHCQKTTIFFEEEKIDEKLIAGAILIVFGIIIYIYLYLR
ncbi:MAG: hypothetical protein ABH850_00695 [Candidatus Micrarchaeota archaeon]